MDRAVPEALDDARCEVGCVGSVSGGLMVVWHDEETDRSYKQAQSGQST